MSIDLDSRCRSQLILKLTQALSEMKIGYGRYLDIFSAVDALNQVQSVLPAQGDARRKINAILGDNPIFNFFTEMIQMLLLEKLEPNFKSPSIPLLSLTEFSDPGSMSEMLVDSFLSLPWSYTVSLRLSESVSDLINKEAILSFGEKLYIIKHFDHLESNFPLDSESDNTQKRIYDGGGMLASLFVNRELPRKWDNARAYIQVPVVGFFGDNGFTETAKEVDEIIRSFLGLGIALNVFGIGFSAHPPFPKVEAKVHKLVGQSWKIHSRYDVTDGLSRGVDNLVFGRSRSPGSPEEWAKFITDAFRRMKALFSNFDKCLKIRRSAQWLFDSHNSQDELLSFVQAMVCLEILLGDDEHQKSFGLSELLRNRCAYLIGRSQSDRTSLMKDFEELYRVRSKIVHTGKSRLSMSERSMLYKLRDICNRVIEAEIILFERDLLFAGLGQSS